MKFEFLSTIVVSVLLCASCQNQDDTSVAQSMEENSRENFGIDVESLGYIVSGPMSMVIEPSALSHIKQDYPIDRLAASGYVVTCQLQNGRILITQTENAQKLRAMFRKSKGPTGLFGEDLGEPKCKPLKQEP